MEKIYLLLYNRILKRRLAKAYKEQINLQLELSRLRQFVFDADEILKMPYHNEKAKTHWINESVNVLIEDLTRKPIKHKQP